MELHTENPELLHFKTDKLNVDILGGVKLTGLDRLRTTLKITNSTNHPLRYTIDLYNSDQTEKLLRRVADHFELEVKESRTLFMSLVESLEAYRLEKNQEYYAPKREKVELSKQEEQKARNSLKDKQLLQKIMRDIGESGVVGEEVNRLLLYLIFTSRKLQNPLHAICLAPSGMGKTHLQESVSKLMPKEEVIEITTLTKNSLYYLSQEELFHTLLIIEDLDGASDESMYAVRELQSKKRLSKLIANKDSKGNIKTETVQVDGVVCISGATTKESVYEDNANRSVLLNLDTSKSQDEAITDYQCKLASGVINKDKQQQIRRKHQDMQRVLKDVRVVNPLAEGLKLPETLYTPRRAMSIYLSLIEVITFLHQYQRVQKKDEQGTVYVETTKEDVDWANVLLKEVLLRKSDDISAGARNLIEELKQKLPDQKSFTTRDIKGLVKVNPTSLKRYLKELLENQLVTVKGNRYTGFEYKIVGDNYSEMTTEIEVFSGR